MALTRIDSYLVDLDSLGGITFDDQAGTPTLKVDATTHRVGIGTASPDALFTVYTSSSDSTKSLRLIDSVGLINIGHWDNVHNRIEFGNKPSLIIGYGAGNYLGLGAGGSERLRINSDGNVGIGTTNPDVKLLVNNGTGDSNVLRLLNEEVALFFGTFGTGSSYPRTLTINGTRSDNGTFPKLRIAGQGGIEFAVDLNSVRAVIDASGNVGIGTTNPSNRLNVVSSAGNGTTIAKFTESTSASDSTSFIALQTGYSQTSETEGLVRLGVLRNGSGNSASMLFETSTGSATVRRAALTNGGFTSDFILLSADGTHQIRNYIDALKYFDLQGHLGGASYNGTNIGLASLPGYGVDLILYLGGRQPILPSGWTGTIYYRGNANASSLGTSVSLQTSTDGDTWTTQAATANTWDVVLSWTQSTPANVPIYVRFRLSQNSGGNVGESACRISNIRITNLYVKPFGFGLANKLISQYNYQNTTLSSDPTHYQAVLLGGSGSYASYNIGHGIGFYSNGVSSSSYGTVVAAINSIDEGSQDAQGLSFCTANSTVGSLSEKLRITNTGNVGIGTTNPQNKVHVFGETRIQSINSNYGSVIKSIAKTFVNLSTTYVSFGESITTGGNSGFAMISIETSTDHQATFMMTTGRQQAVAHRYTFYSPSNCTITENTEGTVDIVVSGDSRTYTLQFSVGSLGTSPQIKCSVATTGNTEVGILFFHFPHI